MSKFKNLSTKEKAEYITVVALYPFFKLFNALGKSLKLFGTKGRQITASILSFTMILSMLPMISLTAFASGTLTVQSSAVGVGNYKQPQIADGINLPGESKSAVYLGQYPQNSSNANDLSPILWYVTEKGPVSNDGDLSDYDLRFVTSGDFNMISQKVLDKSKYVNYGKLSKSPWKYYDNTCWCVPYTKSELLKFEQSFYEKAFNDLEKKAGPSPTEMRVITPGGMGYEHYYQTEETGNRVYSPYWGSEGSDKGITWNAEATPYAISRGVQTGVNGATYWTRGPATLRQLLYRSHVVKTPDSQWPTYQEDGKGQERGVRPMTKLSYDSVIMASIEGLKDAGFIVNGEASTQNYELTLLDSSRQFTAQLSASVAQTDTTVTVPVSYQNANTGENEYISYILESDQGTMMEYRRVKASDAASGSFNIEIPKSALARNDYKLKVFNEKLIPGVACDYSSAVSVLNIPVDHSNDQLTCWQDVQDAIDADRYVKLTQDLTAGDSDSQLVIAEGQDITLDLNGYTLDRNMLTPTYNGRVIQNNGSLTITDTSPLKNGKITGGNETQNGGGINSVGTLNINAGLITGNNAGNMGGGIYHGGYQSISFTIKKAFVKNNHANKKGGGIYIGYSKNLPTIAGGGMVIQENTSGELGGGLFCESDCYLFGQIEINKNTVNDAQNNACFQSYALITDSLGPMIRVVPYNSFPKTIAKCVNDYVFNSTDVRSFVSDIPGYAPYLNENNEIVMDKIPLPNLSKYDFTFTAPDDLTYSGTEKTATVTPNANIDCGDITIKYYDETGAEVSPKNAGTYTVKINAAGNGNYNPAANLEIGSFTITQKELTVSVKDIVINKGQDLPAFEFNFTGFVNDEKLEDFNNDSNFVYPQIKLDETVDTMDTTLTSFNVSYLSSGSVPANYKYKYVNTVNIKINKVNITDADFAASKDITKWQKENITMSPKGDYTQISVDGTTWVNSLTLSQEGTGSSQTFYLKKADGTITESKTITYKLDKTAPTDIQVQYNQNGFKSFLNTITFGLFFKENVNIEAIASDSLSEIASYQYYAADTAVIDVNMITDWQSSLTLMQNSKKIVYIKVTDKAGNETIVTDQGVVVYTDSTVTPTTAEFDLKTDKQADVDITLTLNDNTLREIKNGNVALTNGTDYTVSDSTVTISKDYLNNFTIGTTQTLTFVFNPIGVEADTTSTATISISIIDTTHRHVGVLHAKTEATCTVNGNIAYWSCTGCDKLFSDSGCTKVISLDDTILTSLGHDFSEKITNAAHLKSAATCTSPAVYYYDCSRCDEISSSKTFTSGETLDHDFSEKIIDNSHLKSAATCTSPAVYYYDCSGCDEISTTDTFEYGTALGHDFTEKIIDNTHLKSAATCTSPTIYYYDCSRCDEMSTTDTFQYGTALGHDFTEQIVDDAHLKSAATCTSPAIYYYDCSRCDEMSTTDTFEYGSALGHDFTGEYDGYDDNYHWHICNRDSCEGTDTKTIHSGGTATYFEQATCEACGHKYGNTTADITAPSGKITISDNHWNEFLNTVTFGLFFKETKTVTITAADSESGVAKIEYLLSGTVFDSENAVTGTWNDITGTKQFNLNEKSKQFIYVRLTDTDGNSAIINSDGVVIYSDSTVTPVTAVFDKKTDKQADISFTMSLNGNTLKDIKNGTSVLAKDTDYTVNGSIVTVKKAYFAKQANGDVTLTFSFYPMGVENNDNLSATSATVTVTDTTHYHSMTKTEAKAATCTADGNIEYWSCSGCLKYFSDENGNTQISLADTVLTKLGHSFTSYTSDDNATYEKDGTETAHCNHTGCNETDTRTASGSKLIDSTAPTGEIKIGTNSFKNFINSITFGLFFKESQTITITGEDSGIGMDKIYYFKSETVLEKTAVEAISADKWTEGASLTLSPDWQGVVYAKITDKSGNALYISSDGLVLDATSPVITGVTDGGNYCNTATVQVTVTETNLDTVKLDGNIVTLTDGEFSVSAKDGSQTIVVTDKAGNKTSATITVYADHVWDEGKVTTEPTTTVKGERTYICSICGGTKTEEISKLAPSIIDGENGIYQQGGKDSLTFKSNASLADFESVSVDGKVIDKANYTTAEGSTIVTLKADYLATLSVGKHTLAINSTTGTASTEFTIAAKAADTAKPGDTQSPKTGDNNNIVLWIGLLLVSGGTVAKLGVTKKRRKVNSN